MRGAGKLGLAAARPVRIGGAPLPAPTWPSFNLLELRRSLASVEEKQQQCS